MALAQKSAFQKGHFEEKTAEKERRSKPIFCSISRVAFFAVSSFFGVFFVERNEKQKIKIKPNKKKSRTTRCKQENHLVLLQKDNTKTE